MRDDPDVGDRPIDPFERGVELAIDAQNRLRIVLTRQLGENVPVGLDRLAAPALGLIDKPFCENMIAAALCEEYELGEDAAVGGFRENAQALRQKQPFVPPMPFLAQRPDTLDQGIGKGGDLARQGDGPLFVILNLVRDSPYHKPARDDVGGC